MTHRTKKGIAYMLLVLFLYNAIGYYPHYLLRRLMVKASMEAEMKKSLPAPQLVKLSFTARAYSHIHWLEANELSVNGELYDVVKRYQEPSGQVVLLCLNDQKETALEAALDVQSDQACHHASSVKNHLVLFKLLAGSFLPGKEQACTQAPVQVSYAVFSKSIPASCFPEVTSPPPKVS